MAPQAPVRPTKKLTSADPLNVWFNNFWRADPEQYHQFRRTRDGRPGTGTVPGTKKAPSYIFRMARAARFKATNPKK